MQTDTTPVSRDIVLLGGGHAHVDVLKKFGMRPQPGTRLTVITRDVHTPYSGMLPGYLAGHYDHAACHIDLQPLARFAGARLYHTSAHHLDLENRLVHCDGRPPVPFDLISIDIGSTPDMSAIAGADEFAIPIKPVDRFLERWLELEQRLLARNDGFRIAVVGGGAGGVEVALSLQHRLNTRLAELGVPEDRASFAVITDTDLPLPRHSPAVRRKMQGFLENRGIDLKTGQAVCEITADSVRRADGTEVPADATVVVTHAGAAGWLGETGLQLDERGFLKVGPTLQSASHDFVFAAGDIAAFDGHRLPKAGVYAVRQGPVLAENLRRLAEGKPADRYRPQKLTLALISSGDPHAVASYGPLALEGAWVWRLKDWIDRRWMKKYQELPKMDGGDDAEDAMRCGGCGAKVASPVLGRVLHDLKPIARPDVLVGLNDSDDAAVIEAPLGKVLVQTVDHFRAFIDDPYLFGRITANHCLGDIFAMGAEPQSALATVTLPHASEQKVEQDLRLLLTGAIETLDAAGAALIGGHTGEGAELSFGLSINGLAGRDSLLRKTGLQSGDALILTKPLGTGAIFAADMRAEAKSAWVDGAIAAMLVSNGPAAGILRQHGATACTDITGFGLLGHLAEMLRGAAVAVDLSLDALPALDGALDLMARGVVSSLHPANETNAANLAPGSKAGHPAYPLLFDPQTAGGLLAGVSVDRADACIAAMQDSGYTDARVIGNVTQGSGGVRLLA
ncbi:MAG: selenide, water dikinase SelD [Minwuiales bacterium]|nr:selenide, water dikinase SelD [Minwuiales bacterium]